MRVEYQGALWGFKHKVLLGELPIAHTANFGRLRWAGDVARMSDNNPVRMDL